MDSRHLPRSAGDASRRGFFLVRSLALVALLAGLLCGGVIGGLVWWSLEAWRPPLDGSDFAGPAPPCRSGPPRRSIHVAISPGWSPRQIGTALRDVGAIRSALLFRGLVHFYGIAHRLQPGSFTFSGHETPEEVIGELLDPQVVMTRVTIPEGLTLREIGQILESRGVVTAASFTQAIHSPSLLGEIFDGWGPIPHAEGLAFPDTYHFHPGTPPEEVARTMLELTRLVVTRIASGVLPLGLTVYQACILASIVERETRLPQERPLVASVFLNRLARRMRLESCATVQYALSRPKERLTYEDLRIDSPYNTYRGAGLPPTPIANFGKAALTAVVQPAVTDYLFFVSDASGGHRFSRTLAEHERFRQLFFRERRHRNAEGERQRPTPH